MWTNVSLLYTGKSYLLVLLINNVDLDEMQNDNSQHCQHSLLI